MEIFVDLGRYVLQSQKKFIPEIAMGILTPFQVFQFVILVSPRQTYGPN